MNICSEHNIERKWIYSFRPEDNPIILESKFECTECNNILMKAIGWEKEKKHGRRRKKN